MTTTLEQNVAVNVYRRRRLERTVQPSIVKTDRRLELWHIRDDDRR